MIKTVQVKIETHVNGESNYHIWNDIKHFYTFSPAKGKITQVTWNSGTYEGVVIMIAKLLDDHFFPLYPSYLMPNNPQNTISSKATKRYNSYRSVRIDTLEWFKVTYCDGNSTRLGTIQKKIDTELLDYIEIDIAKPHLKNTTPDYITSSAS